ncbi:K(+)-transporting ATPase subunit F [soil metagenome]
MKKILKIIGILILLLIVFVLIAGIFIKKEYHLEKAIVIKAPREKLWSHVNSLRHFTTWSPFVEKDPNARLTYEGMDGVVGSKYSWDGNSSVGSGTQILTGIDSASSVKSHLHFIKPMEGEAESYLNISDAGNGSTKVSWGFDSKYKYPMNVMTLFMDGMMGDMFNKGLTKLKTLSEAN